MSILLICPRLSRGKDWETYPEMLDSIDRTAKGVNIMSYFGIAPCMVYYMGLENARKRPATPDEMDKMKQCFREAMEAGACNFSRCRESPTSKRFKSL